MTEQRQPKDPPPPEAKTETDPHGHAPHGIPPEADQAKAKGTPHAQRQETETVANKS